MHLDKVLNQDFLLQKGASFFGKKCLKDVSQPKRASIVRFVQKKFHKCTLYLITTGLTLVNSALTSESVRMMLASIGLKVSKLIVSLLPEPSVVSLTDSSRLYLMPSSLNSWLMPK